MQTFPQFPDLSFCLEAFGDVNKHLAVNGSMNKGSSTINLSGLQIHQNAHDEQESHGQPHDNRGKGFKAVNSFCLFKSPDTVSCLKFLNTAIWMSLPFECPDA